MSRDPKKYFDFTLDEFTELVYTLKISPLLTLPFVKLPPVKGPIKWTKCPAVINYYFTLYTAVSTKVIPLKCKSVRDNSMPISIMGSKNLVQCLIKVQGDLATRNEKERVCVCAVFFLQAETL